MNWTVIQIFLDILLVAAVGYGLFRIKSDERFLGSQEKRIDELTDLKGSLDEMIREALEVSNRISADIDRKQTLAAEISNLLEREKSELYRLLEEVKSKGAGSPLSRPVSSLAEWKDKYSEALKLADSGMNPQEISRKTHIPVGEIELALNLRK
ncbi:MAG: hypothetical protein ACE5E9_04720 [Nitrospinaceae bacterium]